VFDTLIRNGLVIDGLGSPGRRADVAIVVDRIAAIGDLGDVDASRVIDAAGLVVAPGFVDIHSHSDTTLLSDGRARSKIAQGVTTEVNGNCGIGVAPASGPHGPLVRTEAKTIDLDPAASLEAETFGEYLDALVQARPAINVATLVGHAPLRIQTIGLDARAATPSELRDIASAARAALDDGAFGVSTGLTQVPLIWSDEDELVAIATAAASRDAVFAIHMRSYADGLEDAVDEAIRVSQRSGARLQISHMTSSGRRNRAKAAAAMAKVDAAVSDGLDVAFDVYPYLAGSANLSQLLPDWVQAGGSDAMVARLADPEARQRASADWTASRFLDWDEIEICLVDPGQEALLGLTLRDAAARLGIADPADAGIELIRATENRVSMIAYGRSDENLMAALAHPRVVIGSDGLAMDPAGPSGAGLPHPRSFGCYPRLLGEYVRERRVIPLERAIAISTSIAASRIGLADRGRIAEGAFADIVIFDADGVADLATYRKPLTFPRGIVHVLVNGAFALADGHQVDLVRAGRVLRRGSAA